jgi:adenosylhomocysteine nucleosidase
VACDVVDMEAYAIAKACRLEHASFACAKYVTDGADHSAADHWRSNVHKAAEEFLALYRSVREAVDQYPR